MVELFKHDLFVYLCAECPPFQQIFHNDLDILAPLTDQLAYKAVAAGICPVCGQFLFIQETDNRPGIINIRFFPERKTIIPIPDAVFHIR